MDKANGYIKRTWGFLIAGILIVLLMSVGMVNLSQNELLGWFFVLIVFAFIYFTIWAIVVLVRGIILLKTVPLVSKSSRILFSIPFFISLFIIFMIVLWWSVLAFGSVLISILPSLSGILSIVLDTVLSIIGASVVLGVLLCKNIHNPPKVKKNNRKAKNKKRAKSKKKVNSEPGDPSLDKGV